ncbi:hypothetical protein C5688_21195 [Methylocystis sp. MitZ-2018]|nr:hypothetical protein C5688_21195 [Methylocystis sp. MitZ-2018]
MRALRRIHRIAAVVGLPIDAVGGAPPARGATRPVAISFAIKADGKELGCGRLAGKLQEARFYVYCFQLVDTKGAAGRSGAERMAIWRRRSRLQ